ncbi:MAG: tRNA 2-thiouridine(34) synthase MnmA [Candidatus Eisenbacteria bacterium]|nr:tRNA 2-thiouridine(34) synthase MnmA [Candidatus Eisenbacteria bacterium]
MGALRVLVGMSGGVDSSVAAALLLEQGFAVSGVTMRIWAADEPAAREPTAESSGPRCGAPGGPAGGCYGPAAEGQIAAARDVCRRLGIPHATVDLQAAFRREVLVPFREAYRAGRTPNPCVRCNPRVKFGALLREVRHRGICFARFATGHYARITRRASDGCCTLRKAWDRTKDQSYFLYGLSQAQLGTTLLPLGERTKAEVRARARTLGVLAATATESQDFMGGDHGALFEDSLPGPILDLSGRRLGEHRGIVYYTIGQRRGLGIAAAEPLYVIAIDPAHRAVVVGPKAALLRRALVAHELCWPAGPPPRLPYRVRARIRYRHAEAPAELRESDREDALKVVFDQPQSAITPGQAVVFYDAEQEDLVLGGGTIQTVS